MKMLTHRTPVSAEPPFVFADLKLYLRVDAPDDDTTIENIGHTAAAELEQFAQIALLTQTIRVTIFDPPISSYLHLPIGPASDDDTPIMTIDGEAFTDFEFVGGNRPFIRFRASYLDLTPSRLNVEYQAGFAATAGGIPADLAQALMDQAALLYDGRSPLNGRSLTASPHFARIGARYRGVQL